MAQTDPSNSAVPLEQRAEDLPQAALRTASTASDLPPVRRAYAELRPDQQFGEYRLIQKLGAGGMGTVYEAEHLESNRRLALKVLNRSLQTPESRARFLREGRLAALVSHPNLVYIYGTEEFQDTPIITMELMTGGTLEELICREGPMPQTRAVDAVLQIIEGLESVWTAGVLHRDIKPSNCFLSPEGAVKVGDFGLSVSSLPSDDPNLTREDCYVGTPAYCSPEQIRGDPLSVRTDLYSVGATFYFLLTGQAPFQGTSVIRLLSKVLEREPEAPSKVRPEVSRELSKVVMRCLEKNPAARYGSYAELRNALLPFSSNSVSPATLGLRLLAFAIDSAIGGGIGIGATLLALRFDWPALRRLSSHPAGFLSLSVIELFWQLAYFGLSEYSLRATPGKALCQLRVISTRGGLSLTQALIRTGMFVVVPELPIWVLMAFLPALSSGAEVAAGNNLLLDMPRLLALLLLFLTIRRSNRFAGLHELLSSTRVIRTARYQVRPRAEASAPLPDIRGDATKIGPYLLLEPAGAPSNGQLLLGYDTRLRRSVWIRPATASQPAIDGSLRSICRPGRLHWLSSRRTAGENWDAYEAVAGSSLLSIVHQPQPWKLVRFWLSDLAEELTAASKDGTFPRTLSLDRVWIDVENRARLLDFPAPGAPPASPAPTEQGSEFQRMRSFLRDIAFSALEGKPYEPRSADDRTIRVPLPMYARSLVTNLSRSPAPEPLAAELRAAIQRSPAVSARGRLALVGGCLLFPLVMTIAILCVQLVVEKWHSMYPDLLPLQSLLSRLEKLDRADQPLTFNRQAERNAIEVYIASRFRTMMIDPNIWDSPSVQQVLTPAQQMLAIDALRKHPKTTPDQVKTAVAEIKPILDELNRWHAPSPTLLLEGAGILGASLIVFIMLPAMIGALLVRGGMLLHSMGLAIVDRRGARASRLRAFARAFVTWAPVLVTEVLLLERSALTFWIAIPLMLLMIVGIIVSLFTPERGLQERLTGTCLVPQ